MDTLLQDVRYALRGLARSPGFTAGVVACFALGIGANTTIFSVVDTLFFRPPAHVQHPDRVVRLYVTKTSPPFGTFTSNVSSFPKYADLRDNARSFSDLAAFYSAPLSLGSGEEARSVKGGIATWTFYPLLGVRPALGRFFAAEEDQVGGARVAVLDYDFWQREFAGDSGVLGKQLLFTNGTYTVIGVAPRAFNGVDLRRVDVWLPISAADPELFGPEHLLSRGSYWLFIIGRLRQSVTAAQAEAEATGLYRRANAGESGGDQATVTLGPVLTAHGPSRSQDAKVSLWLATVSAIVLLIACANVANLLLSRAMQRKREVAVRLALGASRGRLVRALLTESVLYALLGAAAALVIALWLSSVFQGFLLSDVAYPETLNRRTIGLAMGAALLVGVLSGLAPALQATRRDLARDLKSGEREGTLQRSGARAALLVGQVALTLMLVVGAGLFVTSLRNVLTIDLGLDSDRILIASADLERTGRKNADINTLYQHMRERVLRLPGVEGASLAIGSPFGWSFGGSFSVPGLDSIPRLGTGGPYFNAVTPDYFRTVGTTIRRGRGFTEADRAGAQRVAIVNETIARLVWPGENALGKCMKIGNDATCTEVVGVAADARRILLLEEPTMMFYVPLAQWRNHYHAVTALLIRTVAPPKTLLPAIHRELQATAPNLPYIDVQPLTSKFGWQVRPFRLGATMFGVFGCLAVILAGLGLYGVLSYDVARRTHEIGVRAALGAERSSVVRLVVAQGLYPTSAGIFFGVIGAVVGGRWLASVLYGVAPTNPVVLGGAAAFILLVGVAASYLPARRAAEVDPMVALRDE